MTKSIEDFVDDLRIRAAIRRKATVRGPDDRLATQLDDAAYIIESYYKRYGELYEAKPATS